MRTMPSKLRGRKRGREGGMEGSEPSYRSVGLTNPEILNGPHRVRGREICHDRYKLRSVTQFIDLLFSFFIGHTLVLFPPSPLLLLLLLLHLLLLAIPHYSERTFVLRSWSSSSSDPFPVLCISVVIRVLPRWVLNCDVVPWYLSTSSPSFLGKTMKIELLLCDD